MKHENQGNPHGRIPASTRSENAAATSFVVGKVAGRKSHGTVPAVRTVPA